MGDYSRPTYAKYSGAAGSHIYNSREYGCSNNEDSYNMIRSGSVNHRRRGGCEMKHFPIIGDCQDDMDEECRTNKFHECLYIRKQQQPFSYRTQPTTPTSRPIYHTNCPRFKKPTISPRENCFNEKNDYNQKFPLKYGSKYSSSYLEQLHGFSSSINKSQMTSTQANTTLTPNEKTNIEMDKLNYNICLKDKITTQELQEIFNRKNKTNQSKQVEENFQINEAKNIQDISEKSHEKFGSKIQLYNTRKTDMTDNSKLYKMNSRFPTSFSFAECMNGSSKIGDKLNDEDDIIKLKYKNDNFEDSTDIDNDSKTVVDNECSTNFEMTQTQSQNDLESESEKSHESDDDGLSDVTEIQKPPQNHDIVDVEYDYGKLLSKNNKNDKTSIHGNRSTISANKPRIQTILKMNKSKSEIISVINKTQRKMSEKSKYGSSNSISSRRSNSANKNDKLEKNNENNGTIEQQYSLKTESQNTQIDTLFEEKLNLLNLDIMTSDIMSKMVKSYRDYHLKNIVLEVERIQHLDELPKKLIEEHKS